MSANNTTSGFYRAVLIIITAIFLFDVQAALIKHMSDRYSVEQISLYRNLFGMVPNIILLLLSSSWHQNGRSLSVGRWQLALGRGVLLIVAQLTFYSALGYLALATATTLAFSGPLFITLLSIPLLGHTVGWIRGAAVLLGFLGVVMVMQPGRDSFSLVALLPVTAAFFYALVSLSSRFFADTVPSSLISIYTSIGALVSAVIIMLVKSTPFGMLQLQDWLWFIAMGGVGGTAVFLLITAYRMAEPGSLSPFEYFGIPFSFLLGWWFFGEAPFESLFPGVFLIVGAGLLVLWRERMISKKSAK